MAVYYVAECIAGVFGGVAIAVTIVACDAAGSTVGVAAALLCIYSYGNVLCCFMC